ncbi:phenylacetic acid degradation protein, partial [Acinetobacter baumannii]
MKNPMEMTGLEFLQAMIEGHIPPASISKTIPMQPTEISEGSVTFKAQADHNHLNP